jgi:hypothetical protein
MLHLRVIEAAEMSGPVRFECAWLEKVRENDLASSIALGDGKIEAYSFDSVIRLIQNQGWILGH